jgi:hypothetical protein
MFAAVQPRLLVAEVSLLIFPHIPFRFGLVGRRDAIMMQKVTPYLWFDGQAENAVRF